jgi:hypothetical protein
LVPAPFYNESHRRLIAEVCKFVEAEIIPHAFEWNKAKKIPQELFIKVGKAGILPGIFTFELQLSFCCNIKIWLRLLRHENLAAAFLFAAPTTFGYSIISFHFAVPFNYLTYCYCYNSKII